MQWADINNHYKKGSDYPTYFNFIDDGSKATSIFNTLSTNHLLTGKKDGTAFEMHYQSSFISSISDKEYTPISGYENSGQWIHVDGKAPTGTAIISPQSNSISGSVSDVSDNGGSGVKTLYAVLYNKNTGKPANPMTVNLAPSSDGSSWTLPSTSTFSIASSMSNLIVEIYAVDNVGNIGILYSTTVTGNMSGTLFVSDHYYENTDVTGARSDQLQKQRHNSRPDPLIWGHGTDHRR